MTSNEKLLPCPNPECGAPAAKSIAKGRYNCENHGCPLHYGSWTLEGWNAWPRPSGDAEALAREMHEVWFPGCELPIEDWERRVRQLGATGEPTYITRAELEMLKKNIGSRLDPDLIAHMTKRWVDEMLEGAATDEPACGHTEHDPGCLVCVGDKQAETAMIAEDLEALLKEPVCGTCGGVPPCPDCSCADCGGLGHIGDKPCPDCSAPEGEREPPEDPGEYWERQWEKCGKAKELAEKRVRELEGEVERLETERDEAINHMAEAKSERDAMSGRMEWTVTNHAKQSIKLADTEAELTALKESVRYDAVERSAGGAGDLEGLPRWLPVPHDSLPLAHMKISHHGSWLCRDTVLAHRCAPPVAGGLEDLEQWLEDTEAHDGLRHRGFHSIQDNAGKFLRALRAHVCPGLSEAQAEFLESVATSIDDCLATMPEYEEFGATDPDQLRAVAARGGRGREA